MDDLGRFLRTKQVLVDESLDALLKAGKSWPAELAEAMRYSLMAPGKRLRPMLVIMATEAADGNDRQALPAACAVEMIHTYSLIHDDLPAMDDDDLRRGQPTCHKQFGEALAILAGDALLTLAFHVLAEGYPSATAAGCCRELATGAGAAGMVGGQVEDLAWENDAHSDADEGNGRSGSVGTLVRTTVPDLKALENIHANKTGALFRASLRLGIWAAQGERTGGPDRDLVDRLDRFGRCFGMVFQITDDLLDVEGAASDIGKGVGKDAARGKLTYPGLLGVPESKRRARQLAEEGRECLAPLGDRSTRLTDLLHYVVNRDR